MPDESQIWLRSANVVILAKYHNPSILNKDFLIHNNIVSDNLEVVESVSTPAVSSIKYSNGMRLFVDQQRLDISKDHNIKFEDHSDDEIYQCAKSYVKVIPHVPYQSLGINYTVSVVREKPLEWITKQFLNKNLQNIEGHMLPRFIINVDYAVLSLSIMDGVVPHDNKNTESVIIDCNLHHNGPFRSPSEIQAKMEDWQKDKSIIISHLKEILRQI